MRKGMWKKGLTVAMAAAMLAGPVSVPAVFNNGISVVKADETNKEQDIYVLMNIPYADFYKAELNKNDVKVDATTSATKTKTKSTLANGSYHADNTGEHISGITYPVKIKAGTDLSKLTKITDASKVSITVNMKGKETTTEYKGKDALFESADYSYYELGTTAPAYYKELTVNENGSYSFGKTTATEKTVKGAAIEKFKTSSKYGDYQLNLNFDKVADSDQISGNTKVLAAVITTIDGTQYGLRHVENIWKGTEFAWGTGFTTQSHGCPISGEHYASMMGKTIDAVTYYTENGVVKYDIDDTYVPYKFDTSAFKVENADVTSGSAKVTVPTLPEAYDAEYAVEGLTNVSVENGTLKYNATGVKPGQYTLNVTDKSSKYVPFSTSFTLTTDNVVAAYNNDVKAPALVAAKDVQADDFANFVKNIQKVSVNGKEYAASGKGAVKLINADGTLVTTADALKAEGTYNIVVTATGYNKTLEFTYTNKSDTTATKPSDATEATKPAATTEATKPAATTEATKPAVKPVKKVTVKKQTAKVKAGKKKLTVTWKKDKNVSGYQIKIATKKNFKGAKTYTVKSYKTYKKVIKKLKAKKKYFVKVRAYKTVGKSKVYGAYSAVRSCKVK
ncbi:MAG: hemoblobin-interacting domain-containing protein [Anaerostipes hadrus]